MTHPLRVAENCTTHALHKAQNLMTHPFSAPAHPPPPILFDQSLRAALNQLVKGAQVESFGEEIRCLENGQEVHKRNRIKSLDPRMEGGFLVVGGRLQKAQALPYKTQHPKIIDSHHELAQLIIEDMHRTYHDPLTEHLLNQIRQDYWIIHCR